LMFLLSPLPFVLTQTSLRLLVFLERQVYPSSASFLLICLLRSLRSLNEYIPSHGLGLAIKYVGNKK
jgi:hypothetical protein